MSSASHPDFETLLLWQTGELEPEQQREVRKHLAACPSCRETLSDLDDLYSEADWASSRVAQRAMHARLASRKKQYQWVRSPWSAAVAAGLIAALILYTTTDLTPEARADTLLSRAVSREAETPFHPHLLRVEMGNHDCQVALAKPDAPVVQAASGEAACGPIDQRLRSAGWNWNNALSAKTFQRWRSSLSRKHDEVRKLPDETEVSTRTDEGPIREATLRLRNADYRAIEARVEFATDAAESSIEITEAPYTAVEVASMPPIPAPVVNHAASIPTLTPLDRSEAEVRLALHRIGADTNILLAADRQADDIRVWGVAPTAEVKTSIAQTLANIPGVSLAVMTESEQKADQAPLPWQGLHGSAPPLAYDQLNDLFGDDSSGRQAFLNGLDAITRRILGEARSRDALIALAGRDRSSEYGLPLRRAANDLGSKLLGDQQLLNERLRPVYASLHQPTPKRPAPLSYEQATQAYLLIHRLFLADDGRGSMTADVALGKLEKMPL